MLSIPREVEKLRLEDLARLVQDGVEMLLPKLPLLFLPLQSFLFPYMLRDIRSVNLHLGKAHGCYSHTPPSSTLR